MKITFTPKYLYAMVTDMTKIEIYNVGSNESVDDQLQRERERQSE